MPTVSIDSRIGRWYPGGWGLCLAAISATAIGCLARPAVVVDDLLEPLARTALWIPSEGDLAAARLARAALVAQGTGTPRIGENAKPRATPAVERALAVLIATPPDPQAKDLVSLGIDLRNATFDNPIAYRSGSRELRSRGGIDPRLRSRLDRTIDDDPIRLAKRRSFDGWHRLWARTFNAISQPLGNSLITGFVMAPFQLANSLVHYFADFSNTEPLSMTDRQALSLRQEFLSRHPDTELTEALEKKTRKATFRLEATLAQRRIRAAETALDQGKTGLGQEQARAAIEILAASPEENRRLRKRAIRIQSEAASLIAEQSRRRLESLEAEPTRAGRLDAEHALARALLIHPSGGQELDQRLADYGSAGNESVDGRTEFILALRQHESGYDFEARKRLGVLASIGSREDKMARHAQALLDDGWQNPHGAFERLERRAVREELAWRLAGEWVRRTRYPNLPTPIAYLVDLPTIAMTIILAPLRALTSPWTGSPDFRRAPALAGYRYLRRFPNGDEQRDIVEWLFDYESDLERWGRALRLADLIPDFDADTRMELVEKTTEQSLARVADLDRRDNRSSVLKGLARDYPDSKGGREAGLRMRAEIEDASPQHIRITKSFLLENPDVAGRTGLGLNPKLLNDDDGDGELHPDGILLRGGRVLEIMLIAEGSDDEDPPESRHRKISKERLSQIASSLDEAVQRNSLIDVGARQSADASRDVYLERASLGITNEVDQRASAESTHVYKSLRERYGLVRGRDSVLPFDLVFRASLGDFTLGAFPRWRPPKETPDAFLYR